MQFKNVLLVGLSLLLIACSSVQKPTQVSLPLFYAWYNGEEFAYVTTDVSDREIAKLKGANYAPRLRDAIPKYPKPPQVKTALERVYSFPNNEQTHTVFPSVPEPLGHLSEDRHYSPLWLMYTVVWKDPSKARELKSEEAIFVAEDEGLVVIERTNVVLNCPVIPFPVNR